MKIIDFLYKYFFYSLWFVPILLFLSYYLGDDGIPVLIGAGSIVVTFLILDLVINWKPSNDKKSIFYIGFIAILLIAVTIIIFCARDRTNEQEDNYYNDPTTTVVFEESLFDVGNVPNDTVINRTYKFRNMGKNPLILYYVDSGCSCTGYSVSEKIIMPDGTGEITLSLDTKEKSAGMFLVNATARMNTKDELHSLRIEGNILE